MLLFNRYMLSRKIINLFADMLPEIDYVNDMLVQNNTHITD